MAYGVITGQKAIQTAAQTSYNNSSTSSIISSNNVQGAIDNLTSNTNSRINSLNTQVGEINSQLNIINQSINYALESVSQAQGIDGTYTGNDQDTLTIQFTKKPDFLIIYSSVDETSDFYGCGFAFITVRNLTNINRACGFIVPIYRAGSSAINFLAGCSGTYISNVLSIHSKYSGISVGTSINKSGITYYYKGFFYNDSDPPIQP